MSYLPFMADLKPSLREYLGTGNLPSRYSAVVITRYSAVVITRSAKSQTNRPALP